jgi:hypothetical protein
MLGAARRRRATGLGLPAAVAADGGGAGGAVHADRAEPGRPVRVRFAAAAASVGAGGAAPGRQRLPLRRAGGGHRLALHRAVHGRLARPGRHLPAAQALLVFACLGSAWPCPTCWPAGAGGGALAAAARRVDGHLPQADGVPDVRHRRLAGVGAGPAERHRRRRRAAGAAGGAEHGGVDAHAARPHALVLAALAVAALACWPGPSGPQITQLPPAQAARADGAGSPGRQAGSSSWWPPASRCSSTSPRPGASPASTTRRPRWPTPTCWPTSSRATWRCCAPTGPAATPPSPRRWRAGPQRRAGLRVLPQGQRAGGAVRSARRRRSAPGAAGL